MLPPETLQRPLREPDANHHRHHAAPTRHFRLSFASEHAIVPLANAARHFLDTAAIGLPNVLLQTRDLLEPAWAATKLQDCLPFPQRVVAAEKFEVISAAR